MIPRQLLIIADDVTGAADSAARCCQAGLAAWIAIAPEAATVSQSAMAEADIVALSTDSRFLTPEAAVNRVQQVVRHIMTATQSERTLAWYKKIDSTLRGNIGAELDAMLPLLTPSGLSPYAIVCPAFPAQQRTLVDGYLCYDQLPPRTLHLPTLLAEQSRYPVAALALPTVRGGQDALCTALQALHQQNQTLVVIDAETEADLAEIVAATQGLFPHALFCGSAGLVGVLAIGMANEQGRSLPTAEDSDINQRRTKSLATTVPFTAAGQGTSLVIVGSGSTMAQQQVAYLHTITTVAVFEIDPQQSVEENLMRVVLPPAKDMDAIVLHLPKPTGDAQLEGEQAREYAELLAEVTAQIMGGIVGEMILSQLIVVGGDTAIHLFTRLEIAALQVIDEKLPGMPQTAGVDSQGKSYEIILKAGNHGDRETLATLLNLHTPS